MVISRGFGIIRTVLTGVKKTAQSQALQSCRNSHIWSYRVSAPEASKLTRYSAEAVGGFMWWWILWHLWHEHEHITGEFEYPDTSKWTDEELGIPPDDEE